MSNRLTSFDNVVFDLLESLYHHSASVRLRAMKSLMKNIRDDQNGPQYKEVLLKCLDDRMNDDSAQIVIEVLKLPTTKLLETTGAKKLVESLNSILYKIQLNPLFCGALSSKVAKHLTDKLVIEQYDNNLILLAIMPLIFPIDSKSIFCKTLEKIVKSPLASRFTFLKNLRISKNNFNAKAYKRHFLYVICECRDTPTVIAFFESVESQGGEYFKQAIQVCHFLMLITACLKESYGAQESLQMFKQISGYTDKFKIERRFEKQETKTMNYLRYIPLQLFTDFLFKLTRHTNFENITKSSWEDSTSVELHYFLNVLEFVTEECFCNNKDSGKQTEWSNILKELFDIVFNDPSMKVAFLLNFYVYDTHAKVKNYSKLRMRAFKLMQELLKNGKENKLKLNATHILKMCIALISSSEDFRLEALASLKVIENTSLEGELQYFVKSVLDRWEQIAICCEAFPLVLYSLLKSDSRKKKKAEMGLKMLRTIMDFLAKGVTFAQFGFIKELLRLIIHFDDLEIIIKLVPLTHQALKMYSIDHCIKYLNEPYASFLQLVCDRFNVRTVARVFLVNPFAWKLIEAIFQNYMVLLTKGGNLKPVPCVFLESFDEYAYDEMPSTYKQKFLHLIIKTLAEAENESIFLATKKLLKRCLVDCRNLSEIVKSMYKPFVNSNISQLNSSVNKRNYTTISPLLKVNRMAWKQGVVLMQLLENLKKLTNTSYLVSPLFELLNCGLSVKNKTKLKHTKQLAKSVLLRCCRVSEDCYKLQKKTRFRHIKHKDDSIK